MARVTNSSDWHDVAPGLGLVLGAVLGLLLGVVAPDTVGTLGIAIAAGAALGLVLGSVVWVLLRRG